MKKDATASPADDQDSALFRQAMAGVRPLRQTPRVTPTPPRPRIRRTRPVSADSDLPPVAPAADDTPLSSMDIRPETTLFWQRCGLRPQTLQQLRRGQFHTAWKLDLHGLTQDAALQALDAFLVEAWSAGARHAIVIHGKGYNSETETPILKNLVAQRLPQLPFVLAFCSARPRDGGAGAVYVFMKKHPNTGGER